MNQPPKIALVPEPGPSVLAEAIAEGGGRVVPLADAEAIVWVDPKGPEALVETLSAAPAARWVQLPWAGIEDFVQYLDHDRTWTCGKGVYAEPVAEMALAMALGGLRGLFGYATETSWSEPVGRNLIGARVTIVGGGGIADALVRQLAPYRCRITVVRSTVREMPGVAEVVGAHRLVEALPGADVVVLALALTPENEGLIGRGELALMEPRAWLVNVARGAHVVTDDLVAALRDRTIGGAALDVTDPEPLPDGHPLWDFRNCIITPHTGNTPEMGVPLLAERVRENVRRFAAGEPLLGLVDVDSGY